MADLVLGGVERIFKAGWAIKEAVETVHQNKEACRDIERCVATVTALLPLLKQLTTTLGEVVPQSISTPALDVLADSMEDALKLIRDCQQRSVLRHLLGAGDMAKKLRRSREDIMGNLMVANFSSITSVLSLQVQISVSVESIRHHVGAHPPLVPPHAQIEGEVSSYDSISSAIEMRSGVNNNTTMVATGNAVPYGSSSRLAEFHRSEGESTLQLTSEECINEGGQAFVVKQKIVIKVFMPCERSRSKAMQLVATAAGVHSLAITGDGKDRLEVVGEGMDIVSLTNALRRKVGHAHLVVVEEGELPGSQRFSEPSSGSSSDPEKEEEEKEQEEEESPHPSSFKGKGKQSQHQVARPHVALRPDGSSSKGSGC